MLEIKSINCKTVYNSDNMYVRDNYQYLHNRVFTFSHCCV